jgi:hypothetical protein
VAPRDSIAVTVPAFVLSEMELATGSGLKQVITLVAALSVTG